MLIDLEFDVIRIDRDAGFTELQEANMVTPACRGDFGESCPDNPNWDSVDACILSCVECNLAILRAVYAE